MSVPNVIGYYLYDAKVILSEAGINIESIRVTAPPRNKSIEFDDSFRVVRQRLIKPKEIELLVCKPL
jgi:hypothetical protein